MFPISPALPPSTASPPPEIRDRWGSVQPAKKQVRRATIVTPVQQLYLLGTRKVKQIVDGPVHLPRSSSPPRPWASRLCTTSLSQKQLCKQAFSLYWRICSSHEDVVVGYNNRSSTTVGRPERGFWSANAWCRRQVLMEQWATDKQLEGLQPRTLESRAVKDTEYLPLQQTPGKLIALCKFVIFLSNKILGRSWTAKMSKPLPFLLVLEQQ